MEIIKYETKINGVSQVVDALQIEDNVFLCIGEFDSKYGMDFKEGKALRNYRSFDLKHILKYIPIEALETSNDARQFLFDMFMGAFVYLTFNTAFTTRLITEGYVGQEENLLLIQFFNIICTSQPGTGFFPYKDVSVDNFIRNYKISDKAGDIVEYNILDLHAYERRSTFRERDWVYMDNVFNTSHSWKNERMPSPKVMERIHGKQVCTLYFTKGCIMIQTTCVGKYKYIWYTIPDDVVRKLKAYDGEMYKYILDALFSIAEYRSDDPICSIEQRVVADEVFTQFAKSLNNNKSGDFTKAIDLMAN